MDDPRIAFPVFEKRAGARRQPDRRPQGRAARAAADRAHAHVRHGRRRGQLPGHQLRDLPRRAAVARRGAVADRALPEPLRVDRGDGELHLPPAAGVRGDAREDDVVVRGGQDHLRRRVADLAPAVGARGVLELRAAARHRRGARLPAADRAGQAQDPRREPRPLHGIDVEARRELGVRHEPQPQEVFQHHGQALGAEDLDEIVADYSDDAVHHKDGVSAARTRSARRSPTCSGRYRRPVGIKSAVFEGDHMLLHWARVGRHPSTTASTRSCSWTARSSCRP